MEGARPAQLSSPMATETSRELVVELYMSECNISVTYGIRTKTVNTHLLIDLDDNVVTRGERGHWWRRDYPSILSCRESCTCT